MTSHYDGWNNDVDSDEEEAQDEGFQSRQATLFLIDATESMLAPLLTTPSTSATAAYPSQPSGSATQPTQSMPTSSVIESLGGFSQKPRSKLELTLRTAYAMMKRKVISSPKDSVGILIYNTAESVGVGDYKKEHFYLLQDLTQPDANTIKALKQLLQNAMDDPDYLKQLFEPSPSGSQNVVGDAFGVCSSIFRARAPKQSGKRIFLVTDNDDPVDGNEQLTSVAMTKRTDLQDMGYSLDVFLIPPESGVEFDITKFWRRVFTMDSDEDDDNGIADPKVQTDLFAALEEMTSSMRNKEAVKRSAFAIPFILGEGLVIGVNGYQLVGEEKKKLPVKVDLSTIKGEEVVRRTTYKDAETGESLDPKKEIKKYFQVGKTDAANGVFGTQIFCDEAEVRKIKTLGRPPSLKLLGFKPREMGLKIEETVKHSYFLYPNEDTYSGSTRTFSALLSGMLKKDVVGFAVLIARATARPQIVLLIPQEEVLLGDQQLTPPGIHVCQLPFADDIRQLGVETTASVNKGALDNDENPPAVDVAKKIIKQLIKNFDPMFYPNPALNFHYDTLAAIALDEELPEADDKAKPAYAMINARVGKYIAEFKKLIPEDVIDPATIKTSKKRRVVEKEEKVADPEAEAEFRKAWKHKGEKMTVPQLKAGLKLFSLSTGGNKPDLIDRLKVFFKKEKKGGGDANDGDDESDEERPRKKKSKRRVVIEDEEDEDAEMASAGLDSDDAPEPDTDPDDD